MLSILKTLSLFSGNRCPDGPDLPSPCGQKFHISLHSHLPDRLMMREASLKRCQKKKNMIQDMINSDDMTSTESTIPNIFNAEVCLRKPECMQIQDANSDKNWNAVCFH